ncbi:MAG: 1-deoxy-D-xylulose-5-phosphate reductoisomerase [Rhodobacter sp.]|nr:1-deoxy-D-xylulose-5-phosphate reductoisomerase [Rhodobacter sp.]
MGTGDDDRTRPPEHSGDAGCGGGRGADGGTGAADRGRGAVPDGAGADAGPDAAPRPAAERGLCGGDHAGGIRAGGFAARVGDLGDPVAGGGGRDLGRDGLFCRAQSRWAEVLAEDQPEEDLVGDDRGLDRGIAGGPCVLGLGNWRPLAGRPVAGGGLCGSDGGHRGKLGQAAGRGQGCLAADPGAWRRAGPVRCADRGGGGGDGAATGGAPGLGHRGLRALRSISIFGATGSVGEQTVDLIQRAGGAEAYRVVALTGGRNVARLAEMARALRAEVAVCGDASGFAELRERLAGSGVQAAAGPEAIAEAADRPADWVMSAIVGAAGLVPGFRALRHGRTLALANKESLVTAGPLLLAEAAAHGATILPVDSEHSAVFQALTGEDISAVERIILTASGGALRDWPLEALAKATVTEALAHPNWAMGQRITIDSASMFNKALEVIETREFFGVAPEQVEVIIHPESLIHSMVGFHDGAIMAHMGAPDMRHSIGYALNWPARNALPVARLDLAQVATLTFRAPDLTRYPALRLAREVMARRGLCGAAFNAAKEVALDHFLAGGLGFMEMAGAVEATLEALDAEMGSNLPQALEDVLAMDHLARVRAGEVARDRARSR